MYFIQLKYSWNTWNTWKNRMKMKQDDIFFATHQCMLSNAHFKNDSVLFHFRPILFDPIRPIHSDSFNAFFFGSC